MPSSTLSAATSTSAPTSTSVQALITLTTDFGLSDPYVGQLKGALLSHCRNLQIIDLTHNIPAWDVAAAATVLQTSFAFFPPPLLHLVVVDPGVGTERAILAAFGGGHFFVAPDNGLLAPLVAAEKIERIHRVERADLLPNSASPTFHGRDIMAPLAARLLQGMALEEVGSALELTAIQPLMTKPASPVAQTAAGDATFTPPSTAATLQGQVQHIDHFGNIRTNLRNVQNNRVRQDEQGNQGGFVSAHFLQVEIAGRQIQTLSRTYGDRQPGELLALIDSLGYLEIAVHCGNAALLLGVGSGDSLTLWLN